MRVRSFSAMMCFVIGGFFHLLETRAAVHPRAGEEIRLASEENGPRRGIVVEVLHDDAIALQRQIEHITRCPLMLDAVEQSVAAAREDVHHLPALEFELAGAAAG